MVLCKRTALFKVDTSYGDVRGEFEHGTAYSSYEMAFRYEISATKAALSVGGADRHEKPRKDRAAALT